MLLPSIPQMMPSMPPAMLGRPPMPQMSLNMDPTQLQFYMMQMQMPVIIQWRFMGQPRPAPLALPLAASVLDLFLTIFNQLHRENLLNASDHIALSLSIGGRTFPIDDKAHAMVPLMSIGLADPSAVVDVSKISH